MKNKPILGWLSLKKIIAPVKNVSMEIGSDLFWGDTTDYIKLIFVDKTLLGIISQIVVILR